MGYVSNCHGAEIYEDAIQAEVMGNDGKIDVDVVPVPVCSKCNKACTPVEGKPKED